eukprot:14093260-Heterocapsa_arctica.AAC.1
MSPHAGGRACASDRAVLNSSPTTNAPAELPGSLLARLLGRARQRAAMCQRPQRRKTGYFFE